MEASPSASSQLKPELPEGATLKYVDEFRNAELARALAAEIASLTDPDRHYKIMEVCGGHTHTIYRHGIKDLLPDQVELVHGPGCPVCVLPMGRVDEGIEIAERPEVIFTCFGDMMREPGSGGNLLEVKAQGPDIRMVYSPLDALRIARENPDREVVFYAIGFGHVSTVIGCRPYEFMPKDYGKPCVVAGFEPLDLLQSILMLMRQLDEERCEVENQYGRVVLWEGNLQALKTMAEVFELRPYFEWRGLGLLPPAALQNSPAAAGFHARPRP